MKAFHVLPALFLLPLLLQAETVTVVTPLRIAPAADAPVAALLAPGSSVTLVNEAELPAIMVPLPADWIAVQYKDSFRGYVSNSQVMKDFSVETGAGVLIEASPGAPLLTVVEQTDDVEVINLSGDWVQITIRKSLMGFVLDNSGNLFATNSQQTAASSSAQSTPPPPAVTSAPNAGLTPIVMSGRLERTRRIFGKGPEQDYQLIDANGKVLSYLEVGSLLTTDPVDNFLGLVVDVSGIPSRPAKSKAIVLKVETLRYSTSN